MLDKLIDAALHFAMVVASVMIEVTLLAAQAMMRRTSTAAG